MPDEEIWELSVSFPVIESEDMEKTLTDMFGLSESAGTWLGSEVPQRDMQWCPLTAEEAESREAQVKELFQELDEDKYKVSIYTVDDEDD